MASMWQKTLFYLGLVDDEQLDTDDAAGSSPRSRVRTLDPPRPATGTPESTRPAGVVAGRRVEPSSRQRLRISGDREHAEAGVYVRHGGDGDVGPDGSLDAGAGESEIIVARTFSDAQSVADFIRTGRPVVLDLRNAEAAMVRRLVDFSSGLTYGLSGKMSKIAQGVILVTPTNVVIGLEERRRLAELGLYTVS